MGSFPDMIQAKLTPQSTEKLSFALDGGMFPIKQMHHATLAFKPNQHTYKQVILSDPNNPVQNGEDVTIQLFKHVFDNEYGVEAVTVKIFRKNGDEVISMNANPHITISHTQNRKPVDSNTLLSKAILHKFEDIPLELDANIVFVNY
jgi:hypothetical protein